MLSSYEWLELLGASVVVDPPSTCSCYACQKTEKRHRIIEFQFIAEDGAIAATLRNDERPEWKQMLAQVANETALLRAGQIKGIKESSLESRMWYSNTKLREMAVERQSLDEAREDIYRFARRTPEQLAAGKKRK